MRAVQLGSDGFFEKNEDLTFSTVFWAEHVIFSGKNHTDVVFCSMSWGVRDSSRASRPIFFAEENMQLCRYRSTGGRSPGAWRTTVYWRHVAKIIMLLFAGSPRGWKFHCCPPDLTWWTWGWLSVPGILWSNSYNLVVAAGPVPTVHLFTGRKCS